MGKTISVTEFRKKMYQDSWRDAKQFLPQEPEKVLVINMELHDIARFENGKWFSLCFNKPVPIEWITHWMPLPEPPETKQIECIMCEKKYNPENHSGLLTIQQYCNSCKSIFTHDKEWK